MQPGRPVDADAVVVRRPRTIRVSHAFLVVVVRLLSPLHDDAGGGLAPAQYMHATQCTSVALPRALVVR